MKSRLNMAGLTLLVGLLTSGCANNRDTIAKAELGDRQGVFTEAIGREVQPGMSTVDIKFSVKSNYARFLWTDYKHTDPPYRVHLNIDGQPSILEAEPVLEDKSPIDSNVPESGTGWKYQFNKRLTLAPGKHKLTIALPLDDVIVEREVELNTGVNTITVTPVYNKRMLRPYKGQNFTAGVNTVEISVH